MILALSVMGGLVMASPARHVNRTILPREPGGELEAHNYKNILPHDLVDVYMCISSPWQGCSHFVVPVGKRKNVKVPYDMAISFVGPDWGARCDLWANRSATAILSTILCTPVMP